MWIFFAEKHDFSFEKAVLYLSPLKIQLKNLDILS